MVMIGFMNIPPLLLTKKIQETALVIRIIQLETIAGITLLTDKIMMVVLQLIIATAIMLLMKKNYMKWA
jgi:hypothetical protein